MALTQISTAGVKDDAVTSGKIPANAVGSSELADDAVDTAAIADDAVTDAKLANSINSSIAANTAKTSNATHTGDVTGSTSLTIANNAVTTAKIADEAVTLAKLPHGDGSSDGKFLRANNGADPTFETVNTNLVADTSPQLGGNLDTNGNRILVGDGGPGASDERISVGDGEDLKIYHDGNSTIYDNGTGNLKIYSNGGAIELQKDTGENMGVFNTDGSVELYKDNIKQLETTENGILLPKGCIRGTGGSKVILGGTLNPGNDTTWNFSFGTNDNGYNQGFVFNVKFYVNHWNGGNYYKYIESISGGRGNTTGLERVDLINNLGTGSASWSNGHLDYSVTLSGGTRDGTNVSLFKVTYDADGSSAYISGYYLEVSYSNQIGTITIT